MGRLSQLPPMIGGLSSRVSAPPRSRAKGEHRHAADKTVASWYGTARWKRLRETILVRDAYTCRDCGRICAGKHPEPDSPVVDHRTPHRNREALFWSPENLQVLCKSPCHDSHKQAQEAAERRPPGVWD